MRSRRPALLTAGLVLAALPLLASTAFAAPGNARAEAAREREATLRYWTSDRMRSAIPRDFVFDPVRGFQPAAKPPGTPGGGGGGGGGGDGEPSSTTSSSSWPNSRGDVYDAVGKVFFTMSGTNYVCSGTVASESRTDRAIVLTAGHCVYDETAGGSANGFASNWMFVPGYDRTPTLNCFSSASSCWTASELVVHNGYATAGGFNDTAVLYDWGFAVVAGDQSSTPSFAITASSRGANTQTFAFGYPAAGKYKGNDLTYCAGPLGFDPYNDDLTYRLACKMTGGSSGGGWLAEFTTDGNNGNLFSVNSYGYSGISAMHGPKFNTATAATWSAAQNVAFDSNSRGIVIQ